MQDNDRLCTRNSLKNRNGPDGIHRTASSIADHADALKAGVNAKDGIWIEARVRAAQDDGGSPGLASCLGHGNQWRWCLIAFDNFAADCEILSIEIGVA